jgi:hypothetical protein
MTTSSNPPESTIVSDETARDLVRSVNRLSRAFERYNEKDREGERRRETHDAGYIESPAIRYAQSTIDPPRIPRNLSWHEKVREKKVSLPVATGWSILGYALIEVIQALIAGRIHLW